MLVSSAARIGLYLIKLRSSSPIWISITKLSSDFTILSIRVYVSSLVIVKFESKLMPATLREDAFTVSENVSLRKPLFISRENAASSGGVMSSTTNDA